MLSFIVGREPQRYDGINDCCVITEEAVVGIREVAYLSFSEYVAKRSYACEMDV